MISILSMIGIYGVMLGAAAALGLTRPIGSLLYGVTSTDPITLRLRRWHWRRVSCKAARASRIAPAMALRNE
jgi:hypothetical protein